MISQIDLKVIDAAPMSDLLKSAVKTAINNFLDEKEAIVKGPVKVVIDLGICFFYLRTTAGTIGIGGQVS